MWCPWPVVASCVLSCQVCPVLSARTPLVRGTGWVQCVLRAWGPVRGCVRCCPPQNLQHSVSHVPQPWGPGVVGAAVPRALWVWCPVCWHVWCPVCHICWWLDGPGVLGSDTSCGFCSVVPGAPHASHWMFRVPGVVMSGVPYVLSHVPLSPEPHVLSAGPPGPVGAWCCTYRVPAVWCRTRCLPGVTCPMCYTLHDVLCPMCCHP